MLASESRSGAVKAAGASSSLSDVKVNECRSGERGFRALAEMHGWIGADSFTAIELHQSTRYKRP